jgi:hypothetical protein
MWVAIGLELRFLVDAEELILNLEQMVDGLIAERGEERARAEAENRRAGEEKSRADAGRNRADTLARELGSAAGDAEEEMRRGTTPSQTLTALRA